MKLSKANVPFTMVANEILSRSDLSLRAKGLYAYLFSKPEGWDFAAPRIATECKESKDIVFRALKELEETNLLTRRRQSSGRMEYHISYCEPEVELTQPMFEVEQGKKPVILSEKNIVSALGGAMVNELIVMFEPVNPSWKRLFANKTQRAALQRVVQSIGFESTRGAIEAAVSSFGKAYAPTITTPVQLEAKIGALGAFVKKGTTGAGVFAI